MKVSQRWELRTFSDLFGYVPSTGHVCDLVGSLEYAGIFKARAPSPQHLILYLFLPGFFSLYIVCPNCYLLPIMAAANTFAFKYFSQTTHPSPPKKKKNQKNPQTHCSPLQTWERSRLGEIKASHQTGQTKNYNFLRKVHVPSSTFNPHKECWLLCCKALTELGIR